MLRESPASCGCCVTDVSLCTTGRALAQVPKDDPMRHDAQPVPIRAGSLVIWSSALPHGTFPNDSSRGRVVQYIKMTRVDDPSGLEPVFTDERLLPPGFALTPLGRKLHGFDEWEADPTERPMGPMPVATDTGEEVGSGGDASAEAVDESKSPSGASGVEAHVDDGQEPPLTGADGASASPSG